MGIKNTHLQYGSIAKWFHWTIAICFLVAYTTFYIGHNFYDVRSDEARLLRAIHSMFGFSVLILVLPRLYWRFTSIQPAEAAGPHWQHVASKWAHRALYFFMIAMPVTGWLGTGGRTINMFWLFEIPTFRGTQLFEWLVVGQMGMDFNTFEKPIDLIHKAIIGRWLASTLIITHILAALYHHYQVKDATMRKMLPGGKVEE